MGAQRCSAVAVAAAVAAVVVAAAAATVSFSYERLSVPSGRPLDAGARFGASIALDNARGLVVGAPLHNGTYGRVYLYDCTTLPCRPGAVLEGEPAPSPDFAPGEFGTSVAAFNGRVLVGAPASEVAYLYICDAPAYSACTASPTVLKPLDFDTYNRFGAAVTLGATFAAVGAWNDTGDGDGDNPPNQGSAYVFQCPPDGDTCEYDVKLIPTERTADDFFGYSLTYSSASGLLAVGAYGANDGEGSVWVYACDDADCLNEDAHKLQNNSIAGADFFGRSLASYGNVFAVGAPGAGVVYLYRCAPNAGVEPECELQSAVTRIGDVNNGFGEAVAYYDGTLAIGAPNADGGRGRVYVFSCPEEKGCTLEGELKQGDGIDAFGTVVALSNGRQIAVAAPAYDAGRGTSYYVNRFTTADVPFPLWAILLATVVAGVVVIGIVYVLYRLCCKRAKAVPQQEYAKLVDDGAVSRYS